MRAEGPIGLDVRVDGGPVRPDQPLVIRAERGLQVPQHLTVAVRQTTAPGGQAPAGGEAFQLCPEPGAR